MDYCLTFAPENIPAQRVLADLARFCRAHASTAHPDPYVAARLDGRREVWLRLQHHLQLDNDALWRLYDGSPPPTNQLKGSSE